MFRVTPLVRNLIIINVVVFGADVIGQNNSCNRHAFRFVPIGSEQFAAYQLFTYMFAHGGFMHLLQYACL